MNEPEYGKSNLSELTSILSHDAMMRDALYGTPNPYGDDRLDVSDLERLSTGICASELPVSQLKLVGEKEYSLLEVNAMVNIRTYSHGHQYNVKSVLWMIPLSFMHRTGLSRGQCYLADMNRVGNVRFPFELQFIGGIVTSLYQRYSTTRRMGYTREYSAVIASSPVSKELSLLFLKYGTINIIYKTDDIRYA